MVTQLDDRHEATRLEVLSSYNILDTPPEAEFDDLTQLAAQICETPMALISLLDVERQWLKSTVGLSVSETPRSIAFCDYTIQNDTPLIVENARLDPRFATNPLVTGAPHIRFYAGAPLITADGHRLGTISVLDRVPRQILAEQVAALQILSRQVVSQLELRRSHAELLEREKYLQMVIQAQPECVKRLDAEGTVLAINPAGLAMVAAQRAEDLIGQSVYPLIAPEHREAFQAFNQNVCQGKPGTLEFDLITCQGQRRSVETHAVPLTEPDGRSIHLAITHDITHHQQSQSAIRAVLKNLADIKFALDQSAIVAITDRQGVILEVNEKFCELSQYSKAELIGQTHRLVNSGHHPASYFETMWQTIARGEVWHGDIRNRAKDGTFYWVDTTIVPMLDAQNVPYQYVAIRHDVTQRKLVETALYQQREREQLITAIAQRIRQSLDLSEILQTTAAEVRQLLQADRVVVYRTNDDGSGAVIAEAVKSGCTPILEQSLPKEIFPLDCYELYRQGRVRRVVDIEQDDMAACLRETLRNLGIKSKLVVPILHEDHLWGLLIAHQCSHARDWTPWESELLQQLATQVAIAVHQGALYQQLVQEARYDSLTQLPNRSFLVDHLERALPQLEANLNNRFAILFLDLDHFKIINDSLGHLLGDRLLVRIAQQLAEIVESPNFVSRLGGDEFVIVVHDYNPMEQAIRLAERIQTSFSQPINIDGYELFITASIGILSANIGYQNAQELLRDADISMYKAKANGKNRYEVFVPAMRAGVLKRLNLETDLRRAIDLQELSLRYQPIVDLKSQQIVGFEALLRWEHPEQGMIPPDDFIPIAEETGLIIPLGLWVIETACRQAAKWQKRLSPARQLKISVNLSARQLQTPVIMEQILAILAATGLAPQQLTLEITESLLVKDIFNTVDLLNDLRSHGICISLDDFGTGYSSLSYLHRMPVDILKIDKSFVNSQPDHNCQQDIVKTILALGEHLGLQIVAEGIETERQRKQLMWLGCELGQGYLFAKPLLPEAIDLLL